MANVQGRTDHRRGPAAVGAACLACLALLASTRSPSVGAPHPRGSLTVGTSGSTPPRRLISRRAGANSGGARQRQEAAVPSASPLLRTVRLGAIPEGFFVDDLAQRVVVLQSTGQGSAYSGGNLVLTLLDARTGAPLRTVATRLPYPSDASGNVVVEVAIDPRSGRLLMAISDTPGAPGRLEIRDPRTLAVVVTRRFHLVTAGRGMLADARLGRLFIRDFRAVGKGIADVVDVIDLGTGTLLRTVRLPTGNDIGDFALAARAGRLFVGSRVLDARSLAVVAMIPLSRLSYQGDIGNASGGGFYVVDEAAGRVVTSQTSTGPLHMTRVSIIDARSGAVLHTIDDVCLAGGIALDTVVGRIACLSIGRLGETEYDAGVDVLDTRSGRLLHQYEIGHLAAATFALDVDARHGRAIVVLASGYGPGYADGITVVDLRSGRGSDSSVTLGQGRPDIVVDQATGRTFVANEGDKTVSVLDTARLP